MCGGLPGPLPHAGVGGGQPVPQVEGGEDGGVGGGGVDGAEKPHFYFYFTFFKSSTTFWFRNPHIYHSNPLCF